MSAVWTGLTITRLPCLWQFHVSLFGLVNPSCSCPACDSFILAVWTGQTLMLLSCLWQFYVGCMDWSNPHAPVLLVTVLCCLYGLVNPSCSRPTCDRFMLAVWTGQTLMLLSCLCQFYVGCMDWSNPHAPVLLVTVVCWLYVLVKPSCSIPACDSFMPSVWTGQTLMLLSCLWQ